MKNSSSKYEILNRRRAKNPQEVVEILLENRGMKTEKEKREFLNPNSPEKIQVKDLDLDKKEIEKAIGRIRKALQEEEEIVVYGDYDADGVCATAILWECLYCLTSNVRPFIPDRFSEGYGIKVDTIKRLKSSNPALKLLITVDNGIVADEAVKKANDLGIDVIITDHHLKGEVLPRAFAIIHTTKLSGSGLAWIFAREVKKRIGCGFKKIVPESLDLVAIGAISDQLPLTGPNRSFAKYGLEELNKTKRVGLLALYNEAGISLGSIGSYEVNFIIAPRINAMGRLEHAIESLRLLCTKDKSKAKLLADILGQKNRERQKILDEIVFRAREKTLEKEVENIILVSDESYHEGVIGLAAAKLVEEFYRPAIVISKKSEFSKASARSIPGFNIIEAIKKIRHLVVEAGGHPMAAGFTIATEKIETFFQELTSVSANLLTDEVLSKKIIIDNEVEFKDITFDLLEEIIKFEPTGIGNPTPTFLTRGVNLLDARVVGSESKHLLLSLEKDGYILSAIGFNMGDFFAYLSPEERLSVVYNIERDSWNGREGIRLKLKDIKRTK